MEVELHDDATLQAGVSLGKLETVPTEQRLAIVWSRTGTITEGQV